MRQGGLILAVGRVRSKKKIEKNKNNKKSTPPKTHHDIHSSPATATTSRRRATRHIPRVSPYTPASIDPGFVEIGLVQLLQLPMAKMASVASFPRPVLLQQMVQKKEKKKKHHRHQQSSQRPPQAIPLLQSCEVALKRVPDPLGARDNILPASVGLAPTWSESLDDIQKNANLTLSCRLLERAPRASITRHTAVTIRHRTIDHHSRCPPTDPLPAIVDSSLGSLAVAPDTSEKSCQRNLHLVERAA